MLTTDANHLFAGKESGQVERCNGKSRSRDTPNCGKARQRPGEAKECAKNTNACETARKDEDADSKIDAGTIAADEKEDQDVSKRLRASAITRMAPSKAAQPCGGVGR